MTSSAASTSRRISPTATSRSYNQYCGLARALDHIGDRWTLLIVRELLVAPARYNELLEGLPGIASNLLANRLKQLEADGLIIRELPTAGSRGVRYKLTELGAGLQPVIHELVRWGAVWMRAGQQNDQFHTSWLAVALLAVLPPTRTQTPVRVTFTVGDGQVHLVRTKAGPATYLTGEFPVDADVSGTAEAIMALAVGDTALEQLEEAQRIVVTGDRAALSRAMKGE